MRINRRTLAASVAVFPVMRSTHVSAQGATPTSDGSSDVEIAAANSRITSLGQYLPGGKLDGTLDLGWVDVERQLFAVARGTEGEERTSAFAQSTFGYAPKFFEYVFVMRELVGFGELEILQAMTSGVLPDSLQMVRLNVAASDLIPVWLEQGFEERQNDYGSFWTIGEDAEFDLSHPVQQVLLSQFNNIAILDDRVIAFAPTSAVLADVMATAAGEQPNMLEGLDPVVEALSDTAVSAWMIDGTYAAYSPQQGLTPEMMQQFEDLIAESNDAAGEMPVIRTLCSGTTEGASRDESLHDDSSVAFMILEVEGEATQAAAVIEWRLENFPSPINGRPYAEILGEVEIEAASETVLRLSTHDGASRAVFSQMIMQADTMLFAWQPG